MAEKKMIKDGEAVEEWLMFPTAGPSTGFCRSSWRCPAPGPSFRMPISRDANANANVNIKTELEGRQRGPTGSQTPCAAGSNRMSHGKLTGVKSRQVANLKSFRLLAPAGFFPMAWEFLRVAPWA